MKTSRIVACAMLAAASAPAGAGEKEARKAGKNFRRRRALSWSGGDARSIPRGGRHTYRIARKSEE